MAEGRSSHVTGGAAPPPASDRDRIIDATIRLVGQEGWRRLSLAAIAAEAELSIVQVYRAFGSKTAILCAFARRIDEETLAAPLEVGEDERPRDRVFDLLMRRFDALQPYRAALAALRRDLPRDPVTVLAMGAALLCSMRLMLEAAGIACVGIGGVIAVKLTTAAYIAAARSWARDESPDLAPTMAVLDRRLRGIERWLEGGRRRTGERETAEA